MNSQPTIADNKSNSSENGLSTDKSTKGNSTMFAKITNSSVASSSAKIRFFFNIMLKADGSVDFCNNNSPLANAIDTNGIELNKRSYNVSQKLFEFDKPLQMTPATGFVRLDREVEFGRDCGGTGKNIIAKNTKNVFFVWKKENGIWVRDWTLGFPAGKGTPTVTLLTTVNGESDYQAGSKLSASAIEVRNDIRDLLYSGTNGAEMIIGDHVIKAVGTSSLKTGVRYSLMGEGSYVEERDYHSAHDKYNKKGFEIVVSDLTLYIVDEPEYQSFVDWQARRIANSAESNRPRTAMAHAQEVLSVYIGRFDAADVAPVEFVTPIVTTEAIEPEVVTPKIIVNKEFKTEVKSSSLIETIHAYHAACVPAAPEGNPASGFSIEKDAAKFAARYESLFGGFLRYDQIKSWSFGQCSAWNILAYVWTRAGGIKTNLPAPVGTFKFIAAPKVSDEGNVYPCTIVGLHLLNLLGKEIKFSAKKAEVINKGLSLAVRGVLAAAKACPDAWVLVADLSEKEIEQVKELGVTKLWMPEQNWYEYRNINWNLEDVRALVTIVENFHIARHGLVKINNVMRWEDNKIVFGDEGNGRSAGHLNIEDGWVIDSRGRYLLNAFISVADGHQTVVRNSIAGLISKFVDVFAPRLAGVGSSKSTEEIDRLGADLFVGFMRESEDVKFSKDDFQRVNSGVAYITERSWDVLSSAPNAIFDKSGLIAVDRTNSEKLKPLVKPGRRPSFDSLLSEYSMGINPRAGTLVNGDVLHVNWHLLPWTMFRDSIAVTFGSVEEFKSQLASIDENAAAALADWSGTEEAYWTKASELLTDTLTTKPAKAAKRITLALANDVPVEGATGAGWKLAGMKAPMDVWSYDSLIAGSLAFSPGINLLIKDENGDVTTPVGIVEYRNAIEVKPSRELNGREYAGDITKEFSADWLTEVVVDGDWCVASCGIEVASTDAIGYIGKNLLVAGKGGTLTEVKWRLAKTVLGAAIHVEWTVVNRETSHKGRGVNKSMYIHAPHETVYNSMNPELAPGLEMVVTSDCLKADVIYSMLTIAGKTFCSAGGKYASEIAEVNTIVEGRSHSEYLYIEPALVKLGYYQGLLDTFVADFGRAVWFFFDGSGEDLAYMQREFIVRDVKDRFIPCAAPTEAIAFSNERGLVADAYVMKDSKSGQEKENILVFFFDRDGNLASYAQRTWVFGGGEIPVINPELFEHATVAQAVSESTQMAQNIRALSRVIGVKSDELFNEQLDMQAEGDIKRAKYLFLSHIVNGSEYATVAGFEKIDLRTVAGIKAFIELCAPVAKAIRQINTVGVGEYNEFQKTFFMQIVSLCSEKVLVIGNNEDKLEYWLPLVASFNSGKSNGFDDTSVTSILREMFLQILNGSLHLNSESAVAEISNLNTFYGKRANGKLRALSQSEDVAKLCVGRKGVHAKRVAIPGLDIDEVAFVISNDEDSPYQQLTKTCRKLGIKVTQGMIGNFVRMPISEGPILKAYFYQLEGTDLIARNSSGEVIKVVKGWSFSDRVFAINPIAVIVDEGDFDGDGSIFFPLTGDYPTKTREELLAYVEDRFGYNPLDSIRRDENGNVIEGMYVEEYFRDHYDIKPYSKLVKKTNLVPQSATLIGVSDYQKRSLNGHELEKIGVGRSYDIWNYCELIQSLRVEFTPDFQWLGNTAMVGRLTEPYEAFLGGYSAENYKVWKAFELLLGTKGTESIGRDELSEILQEAKLNFSSDNISAMYAGTSLTGSLVRLASRQKDANTLETLSAKLFGAGKSNLLAAVLFVYEIARANYQPLTKDLDDSIWAKEEAVIGSDRAPNFTATEKKAIAHKQLLEVVLTLGEESLNSSLVANLAFRAATQLKSALSFRYNISAEDLSVAIEQIDREIKYVEVATVESSSVIMEETVAEDYYQFEETEIIIEDDSDYYLNYDEELEMEMYQNVQNTTVDAVAEVAATTTAEINTELNINNSTPVDELDALELQSLQTKQEADEAELRVAALKAKIEAAKAAKIRRAELKDAIAADKLRAQKAKEEEERLLAELAELETENEIASDSLVIVETVVTTQEPLSRKERSRQRRQIGIAQNIRQQQDKTVVEEDMSVEPKSSEEIEAAINRLYDETCFEKNAMGSFGDFNFR